MMSPVTAYANEPDEEITISDDELNDEEIGTLEEVTNNDKLQNEGFVTIEDEDVPLAATVIYEDEAIPEEKPVSWLWTAPLLGVAGMGAYCMINRKDEEEKVNYPDLTHSV